MNRRRFLSVPAGQLGVLGLAALAASLPGCEPPSEGRPAGSIEVKNARSSADDLEAARAKAKSSPKRR
jgi:hypothetical protein